MQNLHIPRVSLRLFNNLTIDSYFTLWAVYYIYMSSKDIRKCIRIHYLINTAFYDKFSIFHSKNPICKNVLHRLCYQKTKKQYSVTFLIHYTVCCKFLILSMCIIYSSPVHRPNRIFPEECLVSCNTAPPQQ